MEKHRRDGDRRKIEEEIQNKSYQALLEVLQQKEFIFRCFNSWRDALAFMRKGNSRDPEKNLILKAIFEAHRTDQDQRWRTLLLAIFWPALESICWQKRHWERDPEERWQNIQWTFLKVVCRINTDRRPHGLVQKVFNDTVHDLWDEYRPRYYRSQFEFQMDEGVLHDLVIGEEDVNLSGVDLRLRQETAIRRFQKHYEERRITEEEFLILVGTRVYGKSVADYAREAGLNYQAAKKRRQRAEISIKTYESLKNTENSCPQYHLETPLSTGEGKRQTKEGSDHVEPR